jgi:hypothetical protein
MDIEILLTTSFSPFLPKKVLVTLQKESEILLEDMTNIFMDQLLQSVH